MCFSYIRVKTCKSTFLQKSNACEVHHSCLWLSFLAHLVSTVLGNNDQERGVQFSLLHFLISFECEQAMSITTYSMNNALHCITYPLTGTDFFRHPSGWHKTPSMHYAKPVIERFYATFPCDLSDTECFCICTPVWLASRVSLYICVPKLIHSLTHSLPPSLCVEALKSIYSKGAMTDRAALHTKWLDQSVDCENQPIHTFVFNIFKSSKTGFT